MKLQNISDYKAYQTTKHINNKHFKLQNISNYKTYQTTKHIRLQTISTTNISNYKTYQQQNISIQILPWKCFVFDIFCIMICFIV